MADSVIYFKHGELVAECGSARVYQMNNELFLELGQGHNLWALESELADYMEQLWDKPSGNCLEIGLGLGVASRYILSCPSVKELTTIEVNSDVIEVHKVASKILDTRPRENIKFTKNKQHTILNADGLYYAYETKRRYDFIFLDFYELIDEETLPQIEDMATACKRLLNTGGCMVGWFDKATPLEFINRFNRIFS